MRTRIPIVAKVIAVYLLISAPLFILGGSLLEDAVAKNPGMELEPPVQKSLLDYASLFLISLSGILILVNIREGLLAAPIVLILSAVAEVNRGFSAFWFDAIIVLILVFTYQSVLLRQLEKKGATRSRRMR